MKRTTIITLIIVSVAVIGLFAFNRLASKKENDNLFAEAVRGDFEIAISASGELEAENSVDIKAPEIAVGRDFHASELKISDLIPEGTEVNGKEIILLPSIKPSLTIH